MRLFLFIFFTLFSFLCYCQPSIDSSSLTYITVSNIYISGNKKTKTSIIKREITFKQGDTIPITSLQENLELSKNQIFNTTLFTEVNYHIAMSGKNAMTVIFTVKERWYILPLPHFKLVDRNFNDWWVTHNGSLNRVDYGAKFYHNNLSGNNDRLVAEYITGYSRQLGLRYSLPFFDKKLTWGINVGFSHIKQREINYNTNDDNERQFLPTLEGFPKTSTKFDVSITKRPNLFTRHIFRIGFTSETINDFVSFANPNYYANTQTKIGYLELGYSINYTKTDYNIYPTKGFSFSAGAYSRFFADENNTYTLNANLLLANKLSRKWYIRNRIAFQLKAPFNTGFSNQNLFGYGSYQLRGLEYYVVDGVKGLMHKFDIGYHLSDFNIKAPIKNKHINKIPFKSYLRLYNDLGYSYSKNIHTNLNERLMHGYGIGLDILTIYDIVFKIEYSFNNLGNNGFFLGRRD
jgi:outer membrane protein assembly factor BamA